MELSYKLQTLQPLKGALDIIRYLGTADEYTADSVQLMEALDLSERAFSKAIRRLATNGYVQMDGDQVYRLLDKGQDAAEELAEFDASAPADQGSDRRRTLSTVQRRLVAALAQPLVAGKPSAVVVGFDTSADGQSLTQPADIVVRVSVIHGEPATPEDLLFSLADDAVQDIVQVTAGYYKQVRLRLQVFQLGPNDDDIHVSGGMYVDVDVVPDDSFSSGLTIAYSTDIGVNIE